MPYIDCIVCRLTTFSAAKYASRDHCPGCGAPLRADRAAGMERNGRDPLRARRHFTHRTDWPPGR
jgi:hypothetical protein